jgi:hypothetical protein
MDVNGGALHERGIPAEQTALNNDYTIQCVTSLEQW